MVAGRDVAVVIVDMPLNLAVLGPNRADGAREAFPAIESWAVGGHSLGGAMACRYAADNADELNGLVLHAASYCDRDVSESGLRVLSVLGAADGVLDAERERESRANLPPETRVVELDGVNHAGSARTGHSAATGRWPPNRPRCASVSATPPVRGSPGKRVLGVAGGRIGMPEIELGVPKGASSSRCPRRTAPPSRTCDAR